MYEITILFSFHMQNGRCNPSELFRIIETISPEVIFEELPLYVFEEIYAEGNNPKTVEATTIKEYHKIYQVEHVPVDTYEKNLTDLFEGFDLIGEKNNEYIKLLNQQMEMISREGYAFLNSTDFDELMDEIHFIEENFLSEVNDNKLTNQYLAEKEMHLNRDNEMIRNIYNYSKLNRFNKALFLCGAEHRKSIVKLISQYEEREGFKLNWKFYKSENF